MYGEDWYWVGDAEAKLNQLMQAMTPEERKSLMVEKRPLRNDLPRDAFYMVARSANYEVNIVNRFVLHRPFTEPKASYYISPRGTLTLDGGICQLTEKIVWRFSGLDDNKHEYAIEAEIASADYAR